MNSVTPFPYDPRSTAVATVDRVHSVVDLLPTFIELAGRIANTEFVPKDLRRRPEAVLAALMSGAERGLGPMESLRSINVIEGKPTLSAEAMRALVLAAGHDIDIVESNATKATVVGRRAGSDSTSPSFTWTMDRARRARLANKDNWQKYPEAMLLARASTDLCRAVFPDVIAGLASSEELGDELAPSEPTTSRRAPARRVPATLAPVPTPALTPAAVDTTTTPEPPPSPRVARDARGGTSKADDHNDDLGGIPGGDAPTWGAAPVVNPAPVHDPNVAKRLHAMVAKAFPDVPATTRDRWRHALVAVVTRKRGDGMVTSSSDLDSEEQLRLSELLVRITAGQATVADGPDDTIEVRPGGGWQYTITLDPLDVTASRGDTSTGADPGMTLRTSDESAPADPIETTEGEEP